ncbi:DNA-3-methyladenine glycosylase 2 family protein [Haloechinothrix aidingensis]|uniref:DNA-3-methyladenine glycosylase 2 family protein n=1 Tax=Haloechinothrix aidingensis TaxID=2752311 RepID=UPI002483A246|nr:AlkA N-terminal domain-containing protein [Haloechinothrix aidingensis]
MTATRAVTTDAAEHTPLAQLWRDFDRCYAAVAARDVRFDGQFITAVRTTGIYCRPSCPALTPRPGNVSFYPTSAAAQAAGFRACRRCLPDAVPGSPEWDLRADLAGRAMRLIGDGVVDREGVTGLARALGYSTRHLTRVLTAELGAGPIALARAHRAHAARLLIEHTPLPLTEVAFAAGFASVRQFNDTIRTVFGVAPARLREAAAAPARRRRGAPEPGDSAPGTRVCVRLPFRSPFDAGGVLDYLAARAVPGVESVRTAAGDGQARYARTLRLPHGPAIMHAEPAADHVCCTLRLTDVRDLGSAVARVRRLFDLDADPVAVDSALAADSALTPRVAATPGIRVPGTVDPHELVVRAVLGQQVSVASARSLAARLARTLGTRFEERPEEGGTAAEPDTLFPTMQAIAEHAATVLRGPARRIAALTTVAEHLASGALEVHVGCDPRTVHRELTALPGIGTWTADYVLLHALGTPDTLPVTDRALRTGAARLNLPEDPAGLNARAHRWRPWRSYAGMHLWRAALTPATAPGTPTGPPRTSSTADHPDSG